MAIAKQEVEQRPRWPNAKELPACTDLDYDPTTDSLLVTFDATRPAEHLYLETGDHGYVALRLALDTGEVVGVEVEDLHTVALPRHPAWRRLAEIAGTGSFKAATPADYPVIAAFVTDVKALAEQ